MRSWIGRIRRLLRNGRERRSPRAGLHLTLGLPAPSVLAPPFGAPLPGDELLDPDADHCPGKQDGDQRDRMIDQRN
jgi:hypothetical protein